jgi:NAD(P)H-hydrate repair Nnr-like enzyme with NAD(P)H-hydrate dehydratase domain
MPRPSLFATRRRLAAGWLFLIGRRAAVTTGFQSSPPSAKCISSPSKHHEYRYKYDRAAALIASKRHSNMSTTASYSGDSNAAAVTVAELPTKWSETITTTTNNNNNQNANLYDPKYLFPPLSSNSHKGSHGRIAILGGSNKYTGAPYYAAQAALNCGVDLATIFCAAEASVPIKCYSPELMVQGVYSIQQLDELLQEEEELLAELEKYKHKNDLITVDNSDENNNNGDDIASRISINKLLLEHDESNSSRQNDLMIQSELLDDTKKMDDIVTKLQKVKQLQESLQEYKLRQEECIVKSVQDITDMFVTLHALCVGPGLGRHPLVFKIVQHVLRVGMECNLTLILDADVLYMLSLDEYRELYDELLRYEGCIMTPNVMEMKRLSSSPSSSSSSSSILGDSSGKNNIIVEKGHVDAISRGDFAMQCAEEGGLKRSGGIGDVLAGTISAYMAWYAILKGSDAVQGLTQQRVFAVWTACCTVKRATKLAFEKKRRAMSSRDVLNEICGVIMNIEEEIDKR